MTGIREETGRRERVVAIVQARLGSSRLPLKSLLCLRGKPLIDWVVDRVGQCRSLCGLVVAIPDTPLDQVLEEHLRRRGINCFKGPENDVLKRFVLAAGHAGADAVLRICADNPLVSPEALDALVGFYLSGRCDYAWNHIPRGNLWPDGLGGEIVSAALLRQLDREARLPAQREHCFNYIWDNPEKFRMATFDPAQQWLRRPEVRLDIDCAEDFRRLALLPLEPDMTLECLMSVIPS